MKNVNPMMVVAVLLWVVCGAAWAGGSIEFSGGFSGGTVPNAVVLTGDNSGGTGTLRIRPSDEDTQLVLCEASNNAATEVCTSVHHANISATQSLASLSTNLYFDSSTVAQRYWTSAGFGRVWTGAGSAATSNEAGLQVYGTSGAEAGRVSLQASGTNASNFFVGVAGTVTTDIRGPILNGGSATCGGLGAGSVCVQDTAGLTLESSASSTISMGFGATNAAGQVVVYNESDVAIGAFGCIGSAGADADTADTCYWGAIGKVINMARTDDVAAGSVHTKWIDNYSASGVLLMDLLGNGTVRPLLYGSQSNCSDGAGAAACSAAPAGSVVIDDGATTVVVSTTAVTANSQIFPVFDSSLGTKLGVTCNTTAVTPSISARTAGTSFTITAADPAGANPACFSYLIVN